MMMERPCETPASPAAGPRGARATCTAVARLLHEQSHGESFLALAMHRFGADGLYVLDEPEAALSPLRQMSMLRRILDLTK